MAVAKARAVANSLAVGKRLVIAADTTVVLERKILNKPVDEADACRMLGMWPAAPIA